MSTAAQTIVGAGFVPLDVILGPDGVPRCQAGGTCGNVVASLAWFGWRAWPAAPLADDPAGRLVRDDLASFGVRVDLLSLEPPRATPVVVESSPNRFSSSCPGCGSRLSRFERMAPSNAERILDVVPSPDVFVFDRASPATIELAARYAGAGALVVYEPFAARPPEMAAEALRVAHVVKYARQRFRTFEAFLPATGGPILEVQTLGADGLRWRPARKAPWVSLPAFPVERVVDTAGCGDWCTAGFIDRIGRRGAAGLRDASAEEVSRALVHGQILSTWNLDFLGARGGQYGLDPAALLAHAESGAAGGLPRPGGALPSLAGWKLCRACGWPEVRGMSAG